MCDGADRRSSGCGTNKRFRDANINRNTDGPLTPLAEELAAEAARIVGVCAALDAKREPRNSPLMYGSARRRDSCRPTLTTPQPAPVSYRRAKSLA
jgi:hypothetical protein